MQKDQALFELSKPCARVYRWDRPTITYGYSQKIEELIDLLKYKREGWTAEKRPTGGGIVFHEPGSISFAVVLLKNGLKPAEAMARTTLKIADFLKEFGINATVESERKARRADLCADYISRHEISFEGNKLIGIAQRAGKKVILQQGSFFRKLPLFDTEAFFCGFKALLEGIN